MVTSKIRPLKVNENIFKKILTEGTLLVKKCVTNEISTELFFNEYNNFYYYNALDGHESDSKNTLLLKKYLNVINLHKDIQTTVVDVVYLGDKAYLSEFLNAGRISIDDAREKIIEIAEKYNINDMLSQLENE